MIRNYVLFFMLLVAVHNSFAQALVKDPVVGFGKNYAVQVDGKWGMPVTTTAEILSNPSFISNVPGFKVCSFQFSMKPSRYDYIGPYEVHGSELDARIKEIIRKHSGASGTIYLEEIQAIGTDKRPRKMSDILLKYSN